MLGIKDVTLRGYARHQLKQDQFTEAAKGTVHWAVEHRQKVIWVSLALTALLAIGLTWWFYGSYRENRAAEAFGRAMLTYNAQLQTGEEQPPSGTTFASATDRAKAAQTQFSKVADQYAGVRSGKLARYFSGITAVEVGDYNAAERDLKAVVDSADGDLVSMAKLALANLYRSTGKQAEATRLYNDLISNPTRAVGKETAQLELAALYAPTQPDEARRLYEQVKKDHPQASAGQIADTRLQSLK